MDFFLARAKVAPQSEALALERVEVKRKAKNLITKIELYLYRRQPGEMREASLP